MNRYRTSAELKDLAKGKLEGHYGMAISAVLVVECINYLVSSLIATSFPTNTITQYIAYLLIIGIVSVFIGILQTGTSLFFLNMACGQPYRIDDIFYGLMNQPMRSLTVSLAASALNLVCLTPYQIFSMLFMNTMDSKYMILMCVTAVVGLLIYVPLSLAISQSFFLLLDFPEYSGSDALKASYKIMKGHKGRLFYIQASFLPLMLLGVLTCGIGFLWLTPYMNMTYTLFFLDIMNPAKTE